MQSEATVCPITQVATLLSDTWTMLILHAVREQPLRFCELERQLQTISTRTLTRKLQKLQEQDLITKQTDGYYTVTERGAGLKVIENAMKRYAKDYLN